MLLTNQVNECQQCQNKHAKRHQVFKVKFLHRHHPHSMQNEGQPPCNTIAGSNVATRIIITRVKNEHKFERKCRIIEIDEKTDVENTIIGQTFCTYVSPQRKIDLEDGMKIIFHKDVNPKYRNKVLTVKGVGYKLNKQGNKLVMNLGLSHPVEVEQEAGITLEVPDNNTILVKGANKEKVGAVAAKIKALRPVEPYHGYGIHYTNETVILKAGKSGGKKKQEVKL